MLLVLFLFALAIIGIIAPKNAGIESTENKVYTIESKEKKAKIKITWNANGGTINGKKTITTTINKGKKIAKLPTTPKRTGYTFKGWYSKKNGGSKISVNTKATKKTTYLAQWKKGTNTGKTNPTAPLWKNELGKTEKEKVLNYFKKKITGTWETENKDRKLFYYADGTFFARDNNPKLYSFEEKGNISSIRIFGYSNFECVLELSVDMQSRMLDKDGWTHWRYPYPSNEYKASFSMENGKIKAYTEMNTKIFYRSFN